MIFILLTLGAALGSFVNVVAMRYDPNRPLFSLGRIGGRSHCVHCRRALKWWELVPVFSYLFQKGRCRSCRASLNPQYLVAEIVGAIIIVAVPWRINLLWQTGAAHWTAIVFTVAFFILFLMSLIDWKWQIIPDEIVGIIALLGILSIFFQGPATSFLGPNFEAASSLGLLLLNRAVALLAAIIIFGGLIAATRGRGMGLGDLKLALALSVLVGWPEILFVSVLAFVSGAVYGIILIAQGASSLRSAVPFGPFLAIGSAILLFLGDYILGLYLGY